MCLQYYSDNRKTRKPHDARINNVRPFNRGKHCHIDRIEEKDQTSAGCRRQNNNRHGHIQRFSLLSASGNMLYGRYDVLRPAYVKSQKERTTGELIKEAEQKQ